MKRALFSLIGRATEAKWEFHELSLQVALHLGQCPEGGKTTQKGITPLDLIFSSVL